MNNLLAEVVAEYAEGNLDISFQFIADNKVPKVHVDKEQIRRLLINLIDNAIAALREYFSPNQSAGKDSQNEQFPQMVAGEQARLTLRSNFISERDSVRLDITDNAAGIPNNVKDRIFEPYYTTKSGGTGLGLAIVSSVIHDHQGSIRVVDNPPRGSKFIIELPREQSKKNTQRKLAGTA